MIIDGARLTYTLSGVITNSIIRLTCTANWPELNTIIYYFITATGSKMIAINNYTFYAYSIIPQKYILNFVGLFILEFGFKEFSSYLYVAEWVGAVGAEDGLLVAFTENENEVVFLSKTKGESNRFFAV